MQDYKFLCAAFFSTMVNILTDRQTHTHTTFIYLNQTTNGSINTDNQNTQSHLTGLSDKLSHRGVNATGDAGDASPAIFGQPGTEYLISPKVCHSFSLL